MSTVSLYSELSNMRRTKVWNINWVHVVTTTFFRPSVAKVTAGQRWLATGDFLAGFVTNSFTPLKKKISIELNYFNIKSHHKKHPMVGHLPPLKQLDRRSNKDIATLLTEHVLHNNIATTCGAASWCCLSDFITATSPSLTNTSFHVTAPPQQPHTQVLYCTSYADLFHPHKGHHKRAASTFVPTCLPFWEMAKVILPILKKYRFGSCSWGKQINKYKQTQKIHFDNLFWIVGSNCKK